MTMSPGGIFLPPTQHDARTDENGAVWIGFKPEELEAFIGTINRANIMVTEPIEGQEQYDGPAYVLRFMPRYFGGGAAGIEITKTQMDRCVSGWVCALHPWLAVGHDDCEAPREPCAAPRHERTAELPPEDAPNVQEPA